jgi:hypothetical protein
MEGGRLSTQNLKGLLDASYDPKKKKVGDFVLDKELSSGTSKVYRNVATGQVVVAHRGTAGITDWGNNAIYAIGGKRAYKLTSRYKEAEKVQRQAEKKYGASNVSTIGHSQGGLQSELLGGRSKEIITLNKATLPFESNTNKNQFDVRSSRDVVSGLNPFAKKLKKNVNIKAQSYNPLTEHSGDILNRLNKNLTIGKGIYIKGFARIQGGVVATPNQPPIQYPTEDEIENAFNRVRTLVRDRLQEGGLTDDRMNILEARYDYITGELGGQIERLVEVVELRQLILDYLEELSTGIDAGDEGLIEDIPTINNWNDELGQELIDEGMPVMNLFGNP